MTKRCIPYSLSGLVLLAAVACGGIPTIEQSTRANNGARGSSGGKVDLGSGGTTNTLGTGELILCGNGNLDENEGCDDANRTPGDGCDGTCKLEYGYACKTAGAACTTTLVCGDGAPGPNEGCDDKNTQSGDGCSSNCMVELGYACGNFGAACTPSTTAPVCGNGATEHGESCDDGNQVSLDGCSATCQTETGFTCSGTVCIKDATCGNGSLNSGEQCDDGNLTPGDCCSASCRLESNCKCSNPPLGSNQVGQICATTVVCGDAMVTGDEKCDDGNATAGDGCSSSCRAVESGYNCPTTGGECSPAVTLCPNASIDPGEGCDDGNATSNDGCSANCRLESGFVCKTAGAACQPKEFCGNGQVGYAAGEHCDDGNVVAGDGCSPACAIESGYSCDNTLSPSSCQLEFCGNGRLTLGEKCDDKNQTSGDGCSSTCQAETGFRCPKVGEPCRPICGDKLKLGLEQCDDGNVVTGDGCNPVCRVEPGYACPTVGAPCIASVCGNSKKEPGESCDDGNKVAGDGCGPLCQKEPVIVPGPNPQVQVFCGDGLLTGIEECDDGNNTDGDGCSATCSEELGYDCTSQLKLPGSVDFKVTYRDFKSSVAKTRGGHPDFQWDYGAGDVLSIAGAACTTSNQASCGRLDAGGKPVLNTANTNLSKASIKNDAATFGLWFRDSNPSGILGVNGAIQIAAITTKTLRLAQAATGSEDYSYSNSAFYPLGATEGYGKFGDEVTTYPSGDPKFCTSGNFRNGAGTCRPCDVTCQGRNFGFTTELRYFFQYRGGETLTFFGDDDVWVFINGRLAVDIGGMHSKQYGRVVLGDDGSPTGTDSNCSVHLGDTLPALGTCFTADEKANDTDARFALTRGGVYEIVLFNAERHTTESNFQLTLSGFLAARSHCGPVCGDGIVAATEECDEGAGKNTGAYGGCTAECKYAAYCGDGTKNGPEACDEGTNVEVYGVMSNGCTPTCQLTPYCGDGHTDLAFGETCDAGSAQNTGTYGAGLCTNACSLAPFCGDGILDSAKGESCDDGQDNAGPTSNCDENCAIKCGNGKVDAGEQCDSGTGKNTGAYAGCNANCTLAPYCGDGFKQAGEVCDDGLNDGSYGTCTIACQLADYCGDGKIDATFGEQCDNGRANQVGALGRGVCNSTCRWAPYCGDHAVNAGEACDDGTNNSDSVAGACRLDCSGYNAPPSTCGNDVVNAGEECDRGALNGTAGINCDSRCQNTCGNGFKDGFEQCDNGTNDGSYGTCNNDCTLTEFCGDGMKNGPEQCDMGAMNLPLSAATGERNICTTSCTVAPYCGDGRVNQASEQCDGQIGCSGDCTTSILL